MLEPDPSHHEEDGGPAADNDGATGNSEPKDQPSESVEKEEIFPADEILRGNDPNEILTRIHEGDPLAVRDRCQFRITQRCLLVDIDRIFQRTVALMTYRAVEYDGEPDLKQWIYDQIDHATTQIISEEREQEGLGLPATEPWDAHHRFVSDLLRIERRFARGGCLRFNDLDDEIRKTFFAIIVEGKTLARYASELKVSTGQVERLLREAFLALTIPDELAWGIDGVDT